MSKYRALPVFFDADQKRWPRLRRGVFLTGLIFSSLFGVLIVSILINPILPKLNLPQSSMLPKGARPPVRWLSRHPRNAGSGKRSKNLNSSVVSANKRDTAQALRPVN